MSDASSSILALDTCTAQGQVALVRDGVVIFEDSFSSERSHNAQLFEPLGKALELCRKDLSMIVAGTGPGSYTGVRIGLAAAQGLGFALGVPVITIPSVVAPAESSLPEKFVVCGDARRGQFYVIRVHGFRMLGEAEQMAAAELLTMRNADTATPWFTFDKASPAGIPDVKLTHPSAARLARSVSGLNAEEIQALTTQPQEPLYLSAPFVTQPKKVPAI